MLHFNVNGHDTALSRLSGGGLKPDETGFRCGIAVCGSRMTLFDRKPVPGLSIRLSN
jgi:hypothetical protein